MTRAEILGQVAVERDAQDKKWGKQDHGNSYWLAILGEEFGEVAREICEQGVTMLMKASPDSKEMKRNAVAFMRKELIQVAAVAVAWIESIDRQLAKEILDIGVVNMEVK